VVQHAFVIEPLESVARRNGADAMDLEHLVASRVNRPQAARVFVFQYLIGNIDWSLVRGDGDDECCHNMKVLTADEELLLIPYDFDLSGLVNARYAKRIPNMRTRSVRERQYNGYCLDGLGLETAIAELTTAKARIMAVLDELDWVDEKESRKRVEFLEAFFAEAAAGGLADRMAKDCIGG
jgi:hypothetical protein